MISATLIELFVLRRPPIAAMACLSAHTYVAWSRLLHRAGSELVLAPPTMEPTPADPTTMEVTVMEPTTTEPATTEQTPADPPTMAPVDPSADVFAWVIRVDGIDPLDTMAPPGVSETP
jgi:hypothetical protein